MKLDFKLLALLGSQASVFVEAGCDLSGLTMPNYFDHWDCSQPLLPDESFSTVAPSSMSKQSTCKPVCKDGYFAITLTAKDFYKCMWNSQWKFRNHPERVKFTCQHDSNQLRKDVLRYFAETMSFDAVKLVKDASLNFDDEKSAVGPYSFKVNGNRGFMCDASGSIDQHAADLLCQSVGFPSGAYAWYTDDPHHGRDIPIQVSDVQCDAMNEHITECASNGWGDNDMCHYDNVVGLQCDIAPFVQVLAGQCFQIADGPDYTYTVCVGGTNEQENGSTYSCGTWNGAEYRNGVMEYVNGDPCGGGIIRTSTVHFECGAVNEILTVTEPETCRYEFTFSVICT